MRGASMTYRVSSSRNHLAASLTRSPSERSGRRSRILRIGVPPLDVDADKSVRDRRGADSARVRYADEEPPADDIRLSPRVIDERLSHAGDLTQSEQSEVDASLVLRYLRRQLCQEYPRHQEFSSSRSSVIPNFFCDLSDQIIFLGHFATHFPQPVHLS